MKLNNIDETPKTIMDALSAQLKAGAFNLTDKKKFCISPRRWLHGKRWEDEIPTTEIKREEVNRIMT